MSLTLFQELHNNVRARFGDSHSSQSMGDWICANTTIKRRPFSFRDYPFQEEIANDMHPDLSCKKCSQVGLSVSLDTPVPTPTGWTTMGEVSVGDTIFDEQGQPTTVTYISPVYTDHNCYRITFDDDSTIVADANHRWYVEVDRAFDLSGNYSGRGRPAPGCDMFKAGVLNTETIFRFHKQGNRNRFAIPNAKALQLPDAELPLDPYYLGLILGDGCLSTGTITATPEDAAIIQQNLIDRGMTLGKVGPDRAGNTTFRVLGQKLPDRKHIPAVYLRASAPQRLDLLRGLLDTDGSITKRGRVSFYNTNPELIAGVEELIASLGFKFRTRRKKLAAPSTMKNGHVITPKQQVAEVSFVAYAEDAVFLLPRKASRLLPKSKGRASEALRRRIVKIEPVEHVPVRCLTVDSPNHLFLIGRQMVPTHNTETQLRKFLAILARGNGLSGIFTLPNEKMFTRVYNTRLKPLIEQDEIFNPPMDSTPVRRRDTVQIRDSFGYITGCTEGDATSTPADFLMHDELDLSPEEMIALYQSRLQNSEMKMTQKFSTPTFVGFGIDKSYSLSDQREYLYRCPSCNHWQIPRFTFESLYIPNYRFESTTLTDLSAEEIATLNVHDTYFRCENPKCHARADLSNSELREWVPTFPNRTAFRGYQVRPTCTARLTPAYILNQLAKYQSLGYPRGFFNTVLGEAFASSDAQIQRGDIEKCMTGGKIPDVGEDTPVYLGVDIGFQCHITLSIDTPEGLPHFILFQTIPVAHLEGRLSELREIYNIVQGASDRFPLTTTVDALRDHTNGLVMPIQYRGTAALQPVRDELSTVVHYSANRTLILDRILMLISNQKMVISGYTSLKETVIAHLTDMVRDEQPDVEAEWKKITGTDHFFHSMALNLLARRVCEHMYHIDQTKVATSSLIIGADQGVTQKKTHLLGNTGKAARWH